MKRTSAEFMVDFFRTIHKHENRLYDAWEIRCLMEMCEINEVCKSNMMDFANDFVDTNPELYQLLVELIEEHENQ